MTDFIQLITAATLALNALAIFDANGGGALNGGGDLRLTSDEAGAQLLNIAVPRFITDVNPANGRGEIYVRHPSYDQASGCWLWWGNAGAVQPGWNDPGGQGGVWPAVWLSASNDGGQTLLNYQAVDNPTVTTTGTPTTSIDINGEVATDYDLNDYANHPMPGITQNYANQIDCAAQPVTVGVIARAHASNNLLETIFSLNSSTHDDRGIHICTYQGNLLLYSVDNAGSAYFGPSYVVDDWMSLIGVDDGVNAELYFDGALSGSVVSDDPWRLETVSYGAVSSISDIGGTRFKWPSACEIDFAFIYHDRLTADYIQAMTSNYKDPGAFATAQAPVAVGGGTTYQFIRSIDGEQVLAQQAEKSLPSSNLGEQLNIRNLSAEMLIDWKLTTDLTTEYVLARVAASTVPVSWLGESQIDFIRDVPVENLSLTQMSVTTSGEQALGFSVQKNSLSGHVSHLNFQALTGGESALSEGITLSIPTEHTLDFNYSTSVPVYSLGEIQATFIRDVPIEVTQSVQIQSISSDDHAPRFFGSDVLSAEKVAEWREKFLSPVDTQISVSLGNPVAAEHLASGHAEFDIPAEFLRHYVKETSIVANWLGQVQIEFIRDVTIENTADLAPLQFASGDAVGCLEFLRDATVEGLAPVWSEKAIISENIADFSRISVGADDHLTAVIATAIPTTEQVADYCQTHQVRTEYLAVIDVAGLVPIEWGGRAGFITGIFNIFKTNPTGKTFPAAKARGVIFPKNRRR
ncbi:hypothetical protein [Paremcibacter congregatus]|uniref:hypothetical protein n=1 Tax=Paremcibacter congregatus TaxID=2043170 RepID=UPI0030EE72B5